MINKHILIGNIGKDATVKTFSNGSSVANFSVATSESWKNKQTGQWDERTDWHNVQLNGALVNIFADKLKKGVQVYIEGKVRTRSYDSNGEKKYTTETIIDFDGKLKILSKLENNQSEKTPISEPVSDDVSSFSSSDDDDIPFIQYERFML